MDTKDCIHNILNLIKDSDTIADSFINFDKIPQVEIDLLKDKVRSLYEQILILDRKNGTLEAFESDTEQDYFEMDDVAEEAKAEEVVEDVSEEEPIEKIEEPKQAVVPDSLDDDVEMVKKMYAKLVAEGKIASEPANAGKEIVAEKQVKKTAFEKKEEADEKIVKAEEPKEKSAKKTVPDQISADVPNPPMEVENTLNKEQEQENIIVEKKPEPIKEQIEETKPDSAVAPHDMLEQKNEDVPKSINDIISKNQSGNVLASKLQNKPVQDLKKAIGINDKFQFIRELFEGNAEMFASVLDHLNSLSSFDEAYRYINEQFSWDEEDAVVMKFLELVNRRYL